MTKEDREAFLKGKVALLPDEPGVYRFLDEKGTVIYVGKAKSLKKRVSSYFVASSNHSNKVRALVRNIADITHTVVPTEADALLLENNMIKSLQPKYNILLKDDKTYPWIAVTSEEFPRAIQTRKIFRDGSQYFGPYSSVAMQKNVLDLVQKLYFLRTCRHKLTEERIRQGKFSHCLEFYIGNCKAPCTGRQSRSEYREAVRQAASVLRGNLKEAEEFLTEKMQEAAKVLNFEEAARYKQRLDMLQNYKSKSVIISPLYGDLDVFSLIMDDNTAYCNFMHTAKGAIVNSYTIEMRLRMDESPAAVLTFAIMQICDTLSHRLAREVLVPFLPETEGFVNTKFSVPVRGDKLKLLELSEKNCKLARIEKLKQIEKTDPERHTDRIMEQMRKDLELDRQPRHIECFDNSNIQGNFPVSSCVVFRDGRPYKKDYRHFNIKTVEGIDDFASMRETLHRRYSRMLAENAPLPDLIVVDGGKGQLSSAYETLTELGLQHKIPIIGLAKRLEEVFYPGDPTPLYLDKSSETLKVLMHIRDEAHRFGITFHRQQRSRGFIISELECIPSLGKKSIEKLLRTFRTVSGIKKASADELAEVIGRKRAEAVQAYFRTETDNTTSNHNS